MSERDATHIWHENNNLQGPIHCTNGESILAAVQEVGSFHAPQLLLQYITKHIFMPDSWIYG